MVSVEERYEHLEKTIRGYNISADLTQIMAAYEYAREHHGEQMRRDGSPYITHPIHVAQIVAEMRLDSESIIAALLHDCIEDTDCTYEDIAKRFGVTVADIVDGVTKLTRVKYSTMEEEQMENLRKMLFAMSRDIRVILIKIADRLHNMRTMEYQTPAKQKKKAFETMEIYAPIAHRLGLAKMKWELEDLSLKYLDPVAYDEINRKLAQASAEHGQFMSRVQEEISCRLLELNVPHATVYGRVKHPYSIYRKMYLQEKTMEELYDLFAFRVLVDTVKDCYNVLGVVHDIYKPILGRFKDYIATPKPNMYHTTVIGEEGIPFEVQIRTYDMHAINEYGVAAHWKYKQGIKKEGGEADYEWIRRLLENQEDADAEEFIHSLKVDMFADEVFVFTPRGDVINLPAGATPIDFAYSIHSAIGNTMVGAKINGRMVGFDYQLHNGDVVEINTSKAAHGPSRDWMKIAKSSEARSKIRQWFKRERREENIAQGRASFESELKHVGLTMSQITASDVLPSILKRVSFQSLDEMYAAIGYGGLTALKAVNRVRDELLQINRAAAMAKAAEEAAAKAAQEAKAAQQSALPKKVKSEKGIVVEGLSNCLVKFSKCCAPVPGDEIIGFITRGYGVSVHRRDCPNAQPDHHVEANQGRWIKVSWSDDIRDSYTTGLEVVCKDRANLLVDISTAVSTCKVNISNLNVHTTADGFAIFHLTLSVTDSRQLDQVMRKIHQISSVMKVNRPAG